MKDGNGEMVTLVEWLKDVKVLVGFLTGGFSATAFLLLYMGEVLGAPSVANNAAELARQATNRAADNAARIERVESQTSDIRETLQITFCTSDFGLSDYARTQLRCYELAER